MAVQGKPQRDKRTQNSPKVDQNKVKDTPRWHLNGLKSKGMHDDPNMEHKTQTS